MTKPSRREVVLLSTCVGLAVCLLYVVMLNRWGIHLWASPLDYQRFGTWSQAISGTATSAALVVTLANLYWQRKTQLATEAEREKNLETAVFQWLIFKEVRNESGDLVARVWDVKVHNSTKAPIYRWKITFGASPHHVCNFLGVTY